MKDGNIRINVIIDRDLRREVKVKAAKEGKTITEIVVDFLNKWVKK